MPVTWHLADTDKIIDNLDMVANDYNPSIQKAEEADSLDQAGLYSKSLSSKISLYSLG